MRVCRTLDSLESGEDLGDTARADGVAAFTHCEGEALFHSDRLDQLNVKVA